MVSNPDQGRPAFQPWVGGIALGEESIGFVQLGHAFMGNHAGSSRHRRGKGTRFLKGL